jgi:hypothetical protein
VQKEQVEQFQVPKPGGLFKRCRLCIQLQKLLLSVGVLGWLRARQLIYILLLDEKVLPGRVLPQPPRPATMLHQLLYDPQLACLGGL